MLVSLVRKTKAALKIYYLIRSDSVVSVDAVYNFDMMLASNAIPDYRKFDITQIYIALDNAETLLAEGKTERHVYGVLTQDLKKIRYSLHLGWGSFFSQSTLTLFSLGTYPLYASYYDNRSLLFELLGYVLDFDDNRIDIRMRLASVLSGLYTLDRGSTTYRWDGRLGGDSVKATQRVSSINNYLLGNIDKIPNFDERVLRKRPKGAGYENDPSPLSRFTR